MSKLVILRHWTRGVRYAPCGAGGIAVLVVGVEPIGSACPRVARQVATDLLRRPGWGGPCLPVGDKPHRYKFTLYALKTERLVV